MKGYRQMTTRPDKPIPVRAWVINKDGDDELIEAEVIGWNRRAVRINWVNEHGYRGYLVVWAGAVERM